MINEVGTIISWSLGILFAILITFMKRTVTSAIWLFACGSSLVGIAILAFIMIETNGVTCRNKDFIQNFKNARSWSQKNQ